MRSSTVASLPPGVRRALAKLGADISTARRKRNLTIPSVSMGIYAMALFAIGFGDAIGDIVAPGRDEIGLLLDIERLPKRVRPKKAPTAL
jgi:hypothetical protein